MRKNRVFVIAQRGIICALAIVLSFIESLIPPLPFLPPGAKLGFSNIAVMYMAKFDGVISAITVTVVKSAFVGATRGATAFIMSFCGGIVSSLIMSLMIRIPKKKFGYILIGIVGGVSHNIGQLIAGIFITSEAIIYYLPVLILSGIFFGAVTGTVLWILLPALEKVNFSEK